MNDNKKYTRTYQSRWESRGACVESASADLFYEEENLELITQVKNHFCGNCPVQHQCLWTAINEDEIWGIWGGMTPGERVVYKNLVDKGMEEEYAKVHIKEKWRQKLQRKAKLETKKRELNARNARAKQLPVSSIQKQENSR